MRLLKKKIMNIYLNGQRKTLKKRDFYEFFTYLYPDGLAVEDLNDGKITISIPTKEVIEHGKEA